MRQTESPNRGGSAVLMIGYVCVIALLVNLFARSGWIHVHLPFLTGFRARWGWALAAAVCFAIAWYLERGGRSRPT